MDQSNLPEIGRANASHPRICFVFLDNFAGYNLVSKAFFIDTNVSVLKISQTIRCICALLIIMLLRHKLKTKFIFWKSNIFQNKLILLYFKKIYSKVFQHVYGHRSEISHTIIRRNTSCIWLNS